MDSSQVNENYSISEIPVKVAEINQKRFWRLAALKNTYSQTLKALSINAVWEKIATILESAPEPQIQEKYDCNGRVVWEIYDPITHRSLTFKTETEFQIWYEQRYRNSSQAMNACSSTSHTWRRWNR